MESSGHFYDEQFELFREKYLHQKKCFKFGMCKKCDSDLQLFCQYVNTLWFRTPYSNTGEDVYWNFHYMNPAAHELRKWSKLSAERKGQFKKMYLLYLISRGTNEKL